LETALSRDGGYIIVDVIPDGRWIRIVW